MGITKPPAYEHPRKRKTHTTMSVPETSARASTDKKPIKKGKAQSSSPEVEQGNEKVILRLAAHPPAKGQVPLYDEMRDSGLSDKEAVLALLRRGTDKLEEIPKLTRSAMASLAYEQEDGVIETNRKVAAPLLKDLKQAVDPYSALTTRALAINIGEAALILAIRETITV